MKTLTVKCGLKLKRNGIRLYNLISKMFTNRLDGAHRVRMVRTRPYGEFVSPGADHWTCGLMLILICLIGKRGYCDDQTVSYNLVNRIE